MNTLPDATFWLRALGMPAAQTVLIIAVVALVVRRLRSARAQRAAWLAGFGAIALGVAGNLLGLDRQVAAWLQPGSPTERAFRVQANLPVELGATVPTADTVLVAAPTPEASAPSTPAGGATGTPLWWPAWVWLAGAGVVAGRRAALRGMFARWWRRRQRSASPAVLEEVQRLARRVGMSGSVRVVEVPALLGPVAFGALRPTIGLPSGFALSHSAREREAMLVHELAHLAGRDPIWLAMAEGICAALWWVPPVWWAQRRLRAACEAAADEASLIVEDGPTVLANCLVTLAGRLPQPGALGVLGMALFRSELGRRVERLLSLRAQGVARPSGGRLCATALAGVVSTATLGLAASAWALGGNETGAPTLLALAQEALSSPKVPKTPSGSSSAEPRAGIPERQIPFASPGTSVARQASAEDSPDAGAVVAAPTETPTDGGDWVTLEVQFQEAPSTNRAATTPVCMDVLTRRLYATGQFGRVTCEPSDEGIKVRLRLKEGSPWLAVSDAVPDRDPWTESVRGLKTLIEHRGRLGFRRVHADSDQLLQANACPDGYEVLAATNHAGAEGQRYIVERGAVLGLTEQQIRTARAVQDPMSSDWRVSIEFTEPGATRFADLTRDAVGRRLAVVLDGEVLMAPVIRSQIPGGRCEISGTFSEVEAGCVAALLQHPLPVGLKLTGLVQPINTVARAESAGGPVHAVNAVGYVRFDAPSPTNATSAATPSDGNRPSLATLVQDARLLYELGKLEEAKAKVEQALRQEPGNQTAKQYQRLIRDAELLLAMQREVRPRSETIQERDTVSGLTNVETSGVPRPGASERGEPDVVTPSPALTLYTRTFRLNPNTMTQSLEGLLGQQAKGQSPVAGLRQILDSLGAQFGEGPSAAQPGSNVVAHAIPGPGGRALFYNERTGALLVRATLSELDTVETVLQMLNEAPPQVVLEVKFVEITQEDSKALGFDWLLGNLPAGDGTNVALPDAGAATAIGVFPSTGASSATPVAPADTGQLATVTGVLTDPRLRSVVSSLSGASTNAQTARELRGDQLDWPGRSVTNAANIRISAALGARLTGILTDPQYRVVLKALEARPGVDILAAPRVTTVSGRQAQIQVVELMTIMTAINPAALVQPGVAPGTNTVPYLTSTIPVGPTIDLIPVVAADGRTIRLTVLPTFTEFLGYDHPGEDGTVRVWQDGQPSTAALPLPRFRVRQMQTQAQVLDGQTLVLGGFPVEATRITKDKVPVLGDLPNIGRLFRSESRQSARTHLLVFLTATIVDPAGNRVNAE